MSKPVHLMVDLETLDTASSACIIQIGACYFDAQTGEIGETFKTNIQPFGPGCGTINGQTVLWWMQQSPEAIKSVSTGPQMVLSTAMTDFKNFASRANAIWSHATFDFVILQETFKRLGLRPFNYKFARDIRTLTSLGASVAFSTREGTHHDALDDAKFQVKYCVEVLKALKEPK